MRRLVAGFKTKGGGFQGCSRETVDCLESDGHLVVNWRLKERIDLYARGGTKGTYGDGGPNNAFVKIFLNREWKPVYAEAHS